MELQEDCTENLRFHISIDCVLLGFNENRMYVLLEKVPGFSDGNAIYKLPGRLLNENENPAGAARCIADNALRNRQVALEQLYTYRADETLCREWSETYITRSVRPTVSIVYTGILKLPARTGASVRSKSMKWHPVAEIPGCLLPGHEAIIHKALKAFRKQVEDNPLQIIEYLPLKFTVYQFRRLCEIFYDKALDVRNFQKKINALPYIEPLDEWEEGVSHRAARYYRFDKPEYNRYRFRLSKN
ncbi:MAG: hypothetical protein LIP00_11260 [Parabacteroides sp.]|nr:hypothetical protein [Parabacteroides sp.]